MKFNHSMANIKKLRRSRSQRTASIAQQSTPDRAAKEARLEEWHLVAATAYQTISAAGLLAALLGSILLWQYCADNHILFIFTRALTSSIALAFVVAAAALIFFLACPLYLAFWAGTLWLEGFRGQNSALRDVDIKHGISGMLVLGLPAIISLLSNLPNLFVALLFLTSMFGIAGINFPGGTSREAQLPSKFIALVASFLMFLAMLSALLLWFALSDGASLPSRLFLPFFDILFAWAVFFLTITQPNFRRQNYGQVATPIFLTVATISLMAIGGVGLDNDVATMIGFRINNFPAGKLLASPPDLLLSAPKSASAKKGAVTLIANIGGAILCYESKDSSNNIKCTTAKY